MLSHAHCCRVSCAVFKPLANQCGDMPCELLRLITHDVICHLCRDTPCSCHFTSNTGKQGSPQELHPSLTC